MTAGAFITGPGTGEGKTFVTRGLAAALVRRHLPCAAIKPIETGVAPEPLDAIALARACAQPGLAHHPGFVRAELPLAPYAVALETGTDAPRIPALIESARECTRTADFVLVEGAGGLLVPISAQHSIADFATALGFPLVLVAADRLGVLSNLLSCVEAAERRGLSITALVLTDHGPAPSDPSPRTNRRILAERLAYPVLAFPHCDDNDAALAATAERIGLVELLIARPAL